MIWLVWILLAGFAALGILGITLWRRLVDLETKVIIQAASINTKLNALELALRVRQGKVSFAQASQGSPTIDSRARTTTRDTDDLPVTGRMGKGLTRKRRSFDRLTDDN